MNLTEKMENVQASIFDYEIKDLSNNIVNIFTEVIERKLISSSDVEKLNYLNALMSHCLRAMQSADYLRLADLLEYELKPLVGGNNN